MKWLTIILIFVVIVIVIAVGYNLFKNNDNNNNNNISNNGSLGMPTISNGAPANINTGNPGTDIGYSLYQWFNNL